MTNGRIKALDEIRLRLIEMSDLAEADALSPQIEQLRKEVEYQKQVLVAMRARTAVRHREHAAAIGLRLPHSR